MFRYPVLLIFFATLSPIFFMVVQFTGDVNLVNKLQSAQHASESFRYFNLTPGSSGHGQIINDIAKCKKYSITDRLRAVGGIYSYIGSIPSMALLEYLVSEGEYTVGCSGSLINQRYVLAATHCLQRENLRNVRLGEYDTVHNPDCDIFGDCQPEPIVVAVEEIVLNPNHDIGLIRLSVEVQYREFFIAPICVPTSYDNVYNKIGDRVWSAGWGKETKLFINYVRIIECSDTNFTFNICADGHQDGNCNRDTNGPLLLSFNEAIYIEGIHSSFGDVCHQYGYSAVYTKLSYFYDWIVNNLKP